MLFNSYIFIFAFLPLTLLGFFYIGKKSNIFAIIWLLFASLFFYAWWDPRNLLIILVSMVVNYAIGIKLTLANKKSWLMAGIAFNLLFIGYFKYAHFVVDNVNHMLSTSFSIEAIALPLAISFFTFQQIAYLLDNYHSPPLNQSFLRYSLFVTFFPQLIAGPIVHHKEMMPQLLAKKMVLFNSRHMALGWSLFIIGLFKKVVIADHLSLFATPVFDAASHGTTLTFFEAWGGTLAYTLQLYFDFSGYTDMALGLGKMFNINLPVNFNSPYKAKNIIEFWKRWHITLSSFLRKYLYIPLGGNRLGHFRRYLNLFLTMLMGGLWHGAGWTFIVWGALHGLFLIINHAWIHVGRGLWKGTLLYRILAQGLTFLCVAVAWVFFRADSFSNAWHILQSMFLGNGLSLPQALRSKPWLTAKWFTFDGLFANQLCYWPQGCAWIIAGMGIVLFAPNSMQCFNSRQGTFAFAPNRGWIVISAMAALFSFLHLGMMSEFLYFQF